MVPPLNESFASLYPICCELHSFLVPSFLKNQPRFLPILFLVEVISSATYFGHIILPSSSWGLKHHSKESHVFIFTKYLSNYFLQNIQETSTSVWTSSHFPSSSWGLKHQSKESYVLITANTYLNIFFKIVRKHPPLSGLPTTSRNCQTNLLSSQHFWNIQLYISEVGRETLQDLLKPNIPFASSIFFQNFWNPQPEILDHALEMSFQPSCLRARLFLKKPKL